MTPSSPDDGQVESAEEVVDAHVVPERRRRDPRLDVGLEHSRYTSPLPRADDLERYARLLPDAPERLLAAGEREQAHRHEVERRLVAIDEKSMPKYYAGQKRGHLIALSLGTGYEVIMLAAVVSGYAVEGIIGAAVGMGAMIWAIRRDTNGGDAKSDQAAEEPSP